ncbi:MAG: hypothetical protein MUE52_21230 [Tabrizicola sp.]|jgi:hypothetical protein|nr:hypothetical protein [Tabrizicola sp.]
MVEKAPNAAPFKSVAALFLDDGQGTSYRGSVFLIQTSRHKRQDIVLGAGHNLVHLADKSLETQLTFQGLRDVNSIAVRGNGSFRYGVADKAMPRDFGVAVLAEALPNQIVPLTLTTPTDKTDHAVGVAGSVADLAKKGDTAIYGAKTTVTALGTYLYSAPGVTVPGMSGGPVYPDGETAQAIGLVHGTGTISFGQGNILADLYVAMTAENIDLIDGLIDHALA